MTMPETPGGGRDYSAVGTEQALPDAGTTGGAREQVRQAKDKVMDQARTTIRDARDRAGSTLAQSRRQAADQIGGIGSAFRRTGETLRGEDQTRFADVADNVARQMDRVADYLRESDGRTIARDIESWPGASRRWSSPARSPSACGGAVLQELHAGIRASSEEEGYERVRPGGEPAGLGGYSSFDREAGGFDDRA